MHSFVHQSICFPVPFYIRIHPPATGHAPIFIHPPIPSPNKRLFSTYSTLGTRGTNSMISLPL